MSAPFTGSQLEVEAGLGEPSIFPLVESIEPRGTVRDVLLDLVGLDQEIHREHALEEVAFVELSFEHQLVEVLKLRQCELPGKQLGPDRLIPQSSTAELDARMGLTEQLTRR